MKLIYLNNAYSNYIFRMQSGFFLTQFCNNPKTK